MKRLAAFLLVCCNLCLTAQVLSVSPRFPYVSDTVTVTYNSNQGNGVLAASNPVFMHAGLITPASSGPSNWQNVQGVWGTSDPNVQMTSLGNGLHKKTYSISSFYGLAAGATVNQLAFVFRNAAGTLVGRNADGSDIFYPVYNANSPLEVAWTHQGEVVEALPSSSVALEAEATRVSTFNVYVGSALVQQIQGVRRANFNLTLPAQLGLYTLRIEAVAGGVTTSDTLALVVTNALNVNPVVRMIPALPHLNDTVTLVYDVARGNQALVNSAPVYLHTGLLTQTTGSVWQNVQGQWGIADPNVLMQHFGDGVWTKTFHVASFYGVPVTSHGIQSMAMVFRDQSGNVVGRTASQADIEYAVLPAPASNFTAAFVAPPSGPLAVGDSVALQMAASASADLTLRWGASVLAQANSALNLNYTWMLTANTAGPQTLVLEAVRQGTTVYDTLNLQITAAQPIGGRALEVIPPFPLESDTISVIYDAAQGNGALVATQPVFAHTGLITSTSTSPSNWQHVQGTWGSADPKVAMASLGGTKHQLSYHIPTFYGINPATVTVQQMAFVFRDSTGSKVGRDVGGQDLYYPISPNASAFQARFFVPTQVHLLQPGQCLSLLAQSNAPADLALYDNGVLVASDSGVTSLAHCQVPFGASGNHLVELVAVRNGQVLRDTVYYVRPTASVPMDPPLGLKQGANVVNDSTLTLLLYAPHKQHVYVLTESNDFLPNSNYQMRRSTDGTTYWITLPVVPNQDFVYQYLVDGSLRIADPYSERILDPSNDGSISSATYPNPYPYPSTKTFGHLSIIRPGAAPYVWDHTNFQAPPKENLMIYELLVRDFIAPRNYTAIRDSVNYLVKLGVNAVQFMPVNEFENNESWGYNPSYHMALDKYYGTPASFKELIDTLHGRGIAVILDVVLNHAEGQSPLAQLWWDPVQNRPASNSPYFNVQCPHPPNCWGNDFNHESPAVQQFVDQVLKYWIEEYRVDGFRFDMSKGFTNGSGGGWDVGRQNLIKRIADVVRSYKPNAYLILEHWADNSEEIVLSNYGMMLWGNVCHEYQEATMGFSGGTNFSPAYHGNRGWNQPGLITYLESHDEERIAYKNQVFGNNALSAHNVRTLPVSMRRMELATLFGHLIPGPKMMWQFQELGYDVSINNPCRVCTKPVRWNYYQVVPRRRLYETTSIINHLKQDYPVFGTSSNFYSDLYGHVKQMGFIHSSMSAVVVGNFDVATQSQTINFPHTGTWYEYFSGQTLSVSANQTPMTLGAGEYRLYTDQWVPRSTVTFNSEESESIAQVQITPNPTSGNLSVLMSEREVISGALLVLIDAVGSMVYNAQLKGLKNDLNVELPSGLYTALILVDSEVVFKEQIAVMN
jgi:glycosidase